jgi:hypothetical protein
MTTEIERLLVRVEANAAQFEAQMKKVNRALYGSAAETRKTLNQIKRDWDKAGRNMAQSLAPVQLAASVALGAIVAFSYNAAKRAEAVDGAFEQTFRDMPAEAKKAVAAISEEFGRLETDVKDNFTQLRSVLTALGVDAEQSLQIVDQLNRRSLDIAAFRDVSDADAFRAVISGITGETEPLKRFGIVVNETATKAELLRLGFKGNASQASEAAKSIARANIILRQSAEMHGQVARESETLAEQEKRTRAEFTKAAEDFGQKFLPIAADVLKWATDALQAFTNLPQGTQAAAVGLLALVAASGPIAAVINGLRAVIGAAIAAKAALAGIAGAGVAGRGAAALGAGAGVAAGGAAALGTGLLVGTAGFAPAPPRDDAPVEERLAFARRHQSGATGYIRRLEAEKARKDALRSGLNDIGNGTPGEQADRAAQAALAGLGDFGLSGGQTSAVGGGSGGRSGRGSVDRTPELRAALELELAIAQARASGNEAAIRAAEEREELVRLTQQYEAAGYANATVAATEHLALINQATMLAEEREKAEASVELILEGRMRQLERDADYQQQIHDALMDQLDMQSALARISGDEGALRDVERRVWLEERTNEILRLRLAYTEAEARARAQSEMTALDDADAKGRFKSFIVEAGTDFGGMVEAAGDRFKRKALEGLADSLWKIVGQAFAGGQGSNGGGISSVLAGLFGFRANGGPVSAGRPYIVGEKRAEVFVPQTNGTIIPSVGAAVAGMGGSARRPVVQVFQVNAQGAVLADSLMSEMRAAGARSAAQAGVQAFGAARSQVPADLAQKQAYRR